MPRSGLDTVEREHAHENKSKMWQRLISGCHNTNHNQCPLRGCRAPEYAAGVITSVFTALASQCDDELWSRCTDLLSPEDQSKLLQDWHNGKKFMLEEMITKLSFWKTLPWVLAALSHPVKEQQQVAAQHIATLLDQDPDVKKHHRLVHPLLTDATLRAELDQLAAGGDVHLRDLDKLSAYVLRWKFCPVVERPIERLHAVVKHGLQGNRRRHPVTVSMANRLPELAQQLKVYPESIRPMADAVCLVKNPRELATHFCLLSHSSILKMKHKHVSLWFKPLAKLMYRTDPQMQGLGPAGLAAKTAKSFRARMNKTRNARNDHIKKSLQDSAHATPASVDAALIMSMQRHLHDMARAHNVPCMVSLQLPTEQGGVLPLGVTPLAKMLGAIPGAAPMMSSAIVSSVAGSTIIPLCDEEADPFDCDAG